MLDLFWIVLGVLAGISGAYTAWNTVPRTVKQWVILVLVGAASGWLGGVILRMFGLELMAFIGAIAAGYFGTWGVFVSLRGRLVSDADLGDRVSGRTGPPVSDDDLPRGTGEVERGRDTEDRESDGEHLTGTS